MRRRPPSTARAPCSRRTTRRSERPLNVYGYSKLLFDQYVRRRAVRRAQRRSRAALFQRLRARRSAQGRDGERRFHLTGSCGGRRGAAVRRQRRLRGRRAAARLRLRRRRREREPVVLRAAPRVRHLQRRHGRERRPSTTSRTRSSRGTARARSATSRFRRSSKARYQSFTQADITRAARGRLHAPFLDVRAGIKRIWTPWSCGWRRARRSRERARQGARRRSVLGGRHGDGAGAVPRCSRSASRRPPIHVLAPAWSLPMIARMPEVARGIEMPLGHGELALGVRRRSACACAPSATRQAIVLPRSLKAALVPWFARDPAAHRLSRRDGATG